MASVDVIEISGSTEIQPGPFDTKVFCVAGVRNAGYGIDPPVISAQVPAPSAIDIATTATISFTVTDVVEGVRLSTVQVFVDIGAGFVNAYLNSGFQNGWSGSVTPISQGFTFALTPPTDLPNSQSVSVRLVAFDQSAIPNRLDTTYTFTTENVEIYNPIICSNEGGGPIDLLGSIPVGTYRVYVGPNGDSTDPQVYNGIPGSGGFLISFKLVSPGVTNSTKPVYFPPLPIGGPYTLTFVGDSTINIVDWVTVVPSTSPNKTDGLRRILPLSYKTGPKSITAKKFPQE